MSGKKSLTADHFGHCRNKDDPTGNQVEFPPAQAPLSQTRWTERHRAAAGTCSWSDKSAENRGVRPKYWQGLQWNLGLALLNIPWWCWHTLQTPWQAVLSQWAVSIGCAVSYSQPVSRASRDNGLPVITALWRQQLTQDGRTPRKYANTGLHTVKKGFPGVVGADWSSLSVCRKRVFRRIMRIVQDALVCWQLQSRVSRGFQQTELCPWKKSESLWGCVYVALNTISGANSECQVNYL